MEVLVNLWSYLQMTNALAQVANIVDCSLSGKKLNIQTQIV